MKNLEIAIKRVKIIKYAFLFSGISILAFIFISLPSHQVETKNSDDAAAKEDLSKKTAKKSYDFEITKSIFEGISSESLPYKIAAETVVKVHDNLYNLQTINAKYFLKNGNLEIKATQGLLNDASNFINLQNDVQINYNDIEITTSEAELDMNNRSARNDSRIHVKYKNSIIGADKFSTKDLNDIIRLDGNVQACFGISDF